MEGYGRCPTLLPAPRFGDGGKPSGSHFYYMIFWYRFCYEPDPRIHETGWDRARTYVGVPFSSLESDPFFQELGSDGFDSNEGCKGELVWMV